MTNTDAQADASAEQEGGQGARDRSRHTEVERGSGGRKPLDLASDAARQLAQLTGRPVDAVVGLRAHEDGWVVTLELVEVSRVPSSTDLLGVYEVTVDRDGEIMGYERVRRHVRGQAGEDHA